MHNEAPTQQSDAMHTCRHMPGEFAGVSSFEACVIKHSYNLIMLSIKLVRSHNTELENVHAKQATCMFRLGLSRPRLH